MSNAKQGWATGLSVFAGAILITVGVFQFFDGLAAIAKNQFFVTINDYLFKFDVTAWGWIHLILGVLLVLVGAAILVGQAWARWTGIVLAGLSALANFLWLPYYPVWAVVIIALDVAVIWALAVWEPEEATL